MNLDGPRVFGSFHDIVRDPDEEAYDEERGLERGLPRPETSHIAVEELITAMREFAHGLQTGYSTPRALMLEGALVAGFVVSGFGLLAAGAVFGDFILAIGGFMLLALAILHSVRR